jgi:hypothetical protein
MADLLTEFTRLYALSLDTTTVSMTIGSPGCRGGRQKVYLVFLYVGRLNAKGSAGAAGISTVAHMASACEHG